ncbi:unnamed protein product [Oikopleura dioica]|uniref:Uncharacterized protein n=1 Tax=Oikopleura dioica TaxID=34765 RepID=E4WXF3_OIKDI|nr:unnamed protein product [Oikopleura dioica]
MKDPTYKERNPSKGPTGVIITLANWRWFEELQPEHENRWGETDKKKRMKRPEEYKAIKERLGRKIVEEAAEFLKPDGIDFFDHVDYINVGTPLTHKHYLNCPEGSIYSADHDITRYLPENLIKSRPETPIRGLTQGGQDILSCGVGTVVTTGLLAAGHVTGRKLLLEAECLKQAKNTVGF